MQTTEAEGTKLASWCMFIRNTASGTLELRETPSGFFWRWNNKPVHLVPLLGVLDDATPQDVKRFFDPEYAMAHLMHCTGIAFGGDCGLAAAD